MSIAFDAPRDLPQRPDATAWAKLCEQLLAMFPGVAGADVIHTVATARAATDLFGLSSEEQLRAAVTIAKNNLRILATGDDLARLDPETHARRNRGG